MSESKYDIDLSPLYELGGGKDFVVLILGKMIKGLPESFEHMENHTRDQNWSGLKSAAHKAKSTFAYLKLMDVKQQLQDIEHNAGAETQVDKLPGMVDTAVADGRAVLAVLKEKMVELI